MRGPLLNGDHGGVVKGCEGGVGSWVEGEGAGGGREQRGVEVGGVGGDVAVLDGGVGGWGGGECGGVGRRGGEGGGRAGGPVVGALGAGVGVEGVGHPAGGMLVEERYCVRRG